ncbi:Uncharacterized protein PECH_003473 [Penicillium ucsense]|uniref:Helicase ATP-binding domain-containing protein n=1 Tax=Penicillium ucsense TaxID=2839758 RepID=A0A8J8VVZ5_9EURO|nr:Uncharacterized protein PECM_002953 [Penicillium ucsense]KAF7737557.1 Uncharacterized protein PECH_003473 [Penicillium ucsense]
MSGTDSKSEGPRMQPQSSSFPSAHLAIRQYYDVPIDTTLADWQLKPDLPTVGEILGTDHEGEEFFIATNHIHGPWPSTQLYLETHYGLLREDATANLRDAVASFRERPGMKDNKNFVIYERVFFTHITMAHRGMAFRVCFSTKRAGQPILWRYSSRLLAGKVVALSPASDKFSTECVIAVVAARPMEGVVKTPTEVDLYFAQTEDISLDPLKEWIMIEARSGYYEAHRHTMTALQKLSRERDHICGLRTEIDVPGYIKHNSVMDFQPFAFDGSSQPLKYEIQKGLPPGLFGHLNPHQRDALWHILTSKLPIIQGPPGTGKTYVSLAVLQLLLAQMKPDDPPIIVTTHTNHALDQMLTHIAKFEPGYIRLGGRSRNARVAERTLFAIRENRKPAFLPTGLLQGARRRHRALVNDIIQKVLKGLDRQSEFSTGGIFVLHGLRTEEQLRNLERGSSEWITSAGRRPSDSLVAWLGPQAVLFDEFVSPSQFNKAVVDYDQDFELLMSLEEKEMVDNEGLEYLKGRVVDLRRAFPSYVGRVKSVPNEVMEKYLELRDMWEIPREDRGAVYKNLHSRLIAKLDERLRSKIYAYTEVSKRLQIGKLERDFEILKTTKLIGMTTTGLSKYRSLISALKPRVVMIEEAAEVLEASVAVACFESLEHLVLVGDHKQLKGSCALHDLAGEPFNLDVSMFERLTHNHFPFVMLKQQRRMAPEIRQLLTPIYDELHDHETVALSEPVPGMGDVRLFFFTHVWPEMNDTLTSKVNEIEALMVVELYTYICASGTSSKDITILTFYNGQRKKILRKLMENEGAILDGAPNVVTVDSYQGEENDVVILSLAMPLIELSDDDTSLTVPVSSSMEIEGPDKALPRPLSPCPSDWPSGAASDYQSLPKGGVSPGSDAPEAQITVSRTEGGAADTASRRLGEAKAGCGTGSS